MKKTIILYGYVCFWQTKRGTLGTFPQISRHLMDKQGLPCYRSSKGLTRSYDSKVYPGGPLNAEKLATAVLLYVI